MNIFDLIYSNNDLSLANARNLNKHLFYMMTTMNAYLNSKKKSLPLTFVHSKAKVMFFFVFNA